MPAELAVALDTTSVDRAAAWAARVGPHVAVLKLGLEFYLSNGHEGVRRVRRAAPDCGLFLDLKLHDIAATVAGGVRAVADLAPQYLTVHAAGGPAMVGAAVTALPTTRIAAVTVLTSIGPQDLSILGLPPATRLVPLWARTAVAAGARAIVSSAWEVEDLRGRVPGDVHLITPGIRPAGTAAQDQSRVATPAAAASWGADLIVVGRPITAAADPGEAAAQIAASIRP